MGKSSDQIREEINEQRSDAGVKIDRLQQQMQDQVDDTRQQVTETVEQVKGEAQAFVTDTVDSVKETVTDFDFEGYVQERPLVSVGAALLGGFLLGAMLGGDDHDDRRSTGSSSGADTSDGGHYAGGIGSSFRGAVQKSGLEDTISNAGAALMGSVTEQLKDMLDRSFPGFSDKLDDAQHRSGSFSQKTKAAQKDAQQR